MKILFWSALLFIFYTYLGYPFLLILFKKIAPKPVLKGGLAVLPRVSIVIVGRNESKTIGKRIENLLAQAYPPELLEIVVVSDGSEDDMVDCAEKALAAQEDRRAMSIVLHYPISVGKAHGLNIGVSQASGEIVVFSDCRQKFAEHALFELVENFADPEVGGVSGELIFLQDEASGLIQEMGSYWRYEKAIRRLESETGSVVGATGAIYAIRRELFVQLRESTLLDDVVTPLQIVQAGYRMIFDGNARAYDKVSANIHREWQRKLRTLTGNWQILSLYPHFFSIDNPTLFFRFFSHKLSRLLVPYALIGLLMSSVMLTEPIYVVFLIGQILLYLAALAGFFKKDLPGSALVRLCHFFCVLNAAAFMSFWYWIVGRSATLWKRG